MPVPAVIEFCGVRYAYPGCQESLHGVNFRIREGGKIAMVGPNGAGKTTLMLICIGILKPNAGKVLFHGSPIDYDRRGLLELRKKIGLVFQNSDTQLFAPTVFQDVAFGPVNLGAGEAEIRDLVRSSLSAVGLSGYERRPPHQLSGGEKKRVAIAGILAMEPEVLIFDEPTSALDPAGAADLMELLDELNAQGKTIIISTHDVELAYQWADEIILMNKGNVFHQGTPAEVFTDRDLIRTTNLRSPVIVELFNELVAKGMLEPGNAPGSVLQLIRLLGRKVPESRPHPGYGTIVVGNVDTMDPVRISEWIGANRDYRLGAMGTRAKDLAERENLHPDFTHGVIDKCILRALTGESSMILTSQGMVERISRRVTEFNEESGLSIRVDLSGAM